LLKSFADRWTRRPAAWNESNDFVLLNRLMKNGLTEDILSDNSTFGLTSTVSLRDRSLRFVCLKSISLSCFVSRPVLPIQVLASACHVEPFNFEPISSFVHSIRSISRRSRVFWKSSRMNTDRTKRSPQSQRRRL
jgi:hypothetical protein